MTVYTDNVARFAVNDRDQAADQKLTAACRDAVAIIRDGRRRDDALAGRDARQVLAAAESSASRILGKSGGPS